MFELQSLYLFNSLNFVPHFLLDFIIFSSRIESIVNMFSCLLCGSLKFSIIHVLLLEQGNGSIEGLFSVS